MERQTNFFAYADGAVSQIVEELGLPMNTTELPPGLPTVEISVSGLLDCTGVAGKDPRVRR